MNGYVDIKKLISEAKELAGKRSAWARGVGAYVEDIVVAAAPIPDGLTTTELEEHLLRGADSWQKYSAGGCALVYTGDIVDRLAPPSGRSRALRRNSAGDRAIDDQARALYQACRCVVRAYQRVI